MTVLSFCADRGGNEWREKKETDNAETQRERRESKRDANAGLRSVCGSRKTNFSVAKAVRKAWFMPDLKIRP